MPAAVFVPALAVSAPPHPALQVCVIVPVRNEAQGLARTLAALAAQTDPQGQPLDPACYEVLLLANNCTDDTAEVAQAFARVHPQFRLHVLEASLPPEEANVGTARRRLMDAAFARFEILDRPHGLLASTDGDTRVAPDWVWQMRAKREQGAQAIGGRVLTEPDTNAQTAMSRGVRLFYLRDTAYLHGLARLETLLDPAAHDPWPRHYQFFGANMAVTADAYCRVGGLPRVPFLEDEALARTLRRADVRVRHSPDVRVWTSARQNGRAACGLSTTLSAWEDMSRAGQPQIVESPAAVEVRLHARAALRCLWQAARTGQAAEPAAGALAETLGVPAAWFGDLRDVPFGEVWDRVAQAHLIDDGPWALRWPRVEITEALPALRLRLAELEGRPPSPQ